MPRTVIKILYVLAGAVTLLAIYLAAKYAVPEMLAWLLYLLAVLFPFLLAIIFSIFMEPLVVFLVVTESIPDQLPCLLVCWFFLEALALY